MTQKVVYLPLEVATRELEAKILLALELVQRSYTVVIGQQWAIHHNLGSLDPGIILFKSHNKILQSAISVAKTRRFFVLAQEEELLGHCHQPTINRISQPSIYGLVDKILSHGEIEDQAHRMRGVHPDKLAVVGNPRVDVLRHPYRGIFKKRAKELRSAHGEYVLINTNFGTVNSQWGLRGALEIEMKALGVNAPDRLKIEDFKRFAEWELNNANKMLELTKAISKSIAKTKVIVRPHPAEDLTRAVDQFKGIENVKVIREGSHIPWILAARGLIHTSCTTGIEAAILGVPAVNFIPLDSNHSTSVASHLVNPVTQTIDQTISQVIKNLDFTEHENYQLDKLKNVIYNVHGNTAFSNIADLIDREGINFTSKPPSVNDFLHVSRPEILRRKFSVGLEEFSSKVSAACMVHPSADTRNLTITELSDSVFLMRKES
jgi:surface carbohydrate biosynthesis protein